MISCCLAIKLNTAVSKPNAEKSYSIKKGTPYGIPFFIIFQSN